MSEYLYVMLSHTDTGMGRFIRFFTKEEYNHVSLTLDSSLQKFVSFARYRQDVPLAGGYVAEPSARLLSCGKTMPVRIFRLEISREDAQKLDTLFQMADRTPLIYNSLGALLSSCHIHCSIPGAYTCLDFACAILGETFPTIEALGTALGEHEIYRGNLFDLLRSPSNCEGIYFQKRGFSKGTWDTAKHFKTLLWRIIRLERPKDPIADCQLNISLKNIPQSSV